MEVEEGGLEVMGCEVADDDDDDKAECKGMCAVETRRDDKDDEVSLSSLAS